MRTYQWTLGRESDIYAEELENCFSGCEVKARSSHDAALLAVLTRCEDWYPDDLISVRPDYDHSYVTVWRVVRNHGRTTVEEVAS